MWAITDLADASYFFALGAKAQARKPGRPGPFDLVDPRAQRGRRGPIQVPRCVKSVRSFSLGRPNLFFLPDNRYNYDLAKISRTKKQTIETEMAENTVHHAPAHLGPASS
jgi:hypothetical protein